MLITHRHKHHNKDDVEVSVQNMLRIWGFPDLVERFVDEGIDREALILLNENHLLSLVPKVGPRLKLWNKIKNFHILQDIQLSSQLPNNDSHSNISENVAPSSTITQNSNYDLNDSLAESPAEFRNPRIIASYENNIDDNVFLLPRLPLNGQENDNVSIKKRKYVEDESLQSDSLYPDGLKPILKQSIFGCAILRCRVLNESLRRKLCKILIDYLFSKFTNHKIPQWALDKSAKEIQKTFPTETATIYFNPYKKATSTSPKIFCSGKLWSKYVNTRKSLGLKDGTDSGKEPEDGTTAKSEAELESETSSITFLKNNLYPWEEVLFHWNGSYSLRKKFLKENGVATYLDTFPVLKQAQGYSLFLQDFEKEHIGKAGELYLNWEKISNKIIALGKAKSLFKDDVNDAVVIYNLPLLFAPITIRDLGTRKSWRPSRKEIQDSFVLYVENAFEMDVKVSQRRETLKSKGSTPQPFLVFVGPLEEPAVYISLEHHIYKMETPLKALDTLFKLFFAVGLKYPCESAHIWTYFQNYLYNIRTEYDRKYGSVEVFKTTINNVDLYEN